MYEKVCETLNNTIKTLVDAKKRGWYNKYLQLSVIQASCECRLPPRGMLGQIMAGIKGNSKLPENKKFLTKDAEFLTKLYNSGVEDEDTAKLMMKVMYGNKFDRMIKKYIG